MYKNKDIGHLSINPLVSIIVPVYNVEKYLRQCLDTITGQSFQDIEILIVNDGSTDDSLKIIKEYELNDKRVKILDKENGGLSSARNSALDIARGDYIAFIDSDDWVDLSMIEVLYKKALDSGADVVLYDCYAYHEDTDILVECWASVYVKNKEYTNLLDRKDLLVPCLSWLKLYKKSFLNKYNLRFLEGVILEDTLWNLKVISLASKVISIKQKLYFYRQRRTSIMGNMLLSKRDNYRIFDIFKLAQSGLDFLDNKFHESEWSAISQAYIIWLLFHHSGMVKLSNRYIYYKKMKYFFSEMEKSSDISIYLNNNLYPKFLSLKKHPVIIYLLLQTVKKIIHKLAFREL